jgi:hypothetical protein
MSVVNAEVGASDACEKQESISGGVCTQGSNIGEEVSFSLLRAHLSLRGSSENARQTRLTNGLVHPSVPRPLDYRSVSLMNDSRRKCGIGQCWCRFGIPSHCTRKPHLISNCVTADHCRLEFYPGVSAENLV